METLKKYWWVIVALIVAVFAFKKRKTIKSKYKSFRSRSDKRRAKRRMKRSYEGGRFAKMYNRLTKRSAARRTRRAYR